LKHSKDTWRRGWSERKQEHPNDCQLANLLNLEIYALTLVVVD